MPEAKTKDLRGVESDIEWKLDGLQEDRNSVVQAMACIASIPQGLWEHTVGVVLNRSHEKTDDLVQTLEAIPEDNHFEGNLADEVVRRLRLQVVNDVLRAEETPKVEIALPGDSAADQVAPASTSHENKVALQVQVAGAKLVGKHRSSRTRALWVEVQATVLRASDGQELYSQPILYKSPSRSLKDWAVSDGREFRNELEECSRRVAEALTDELIGHGFVRQGSGSFETNSPAQGAENR
jgi:hypothetical protein